MTFSGKMCLTIILKVTKNQSFALSLENAVLEKPLGDFNLTASLFEVKLLLISFKNL